MGVTQSASTFKYGVKDRVKDASGTRRIRDTVRVEGHQSI